jgi:hypothetical protein
LHNVGYATAHGDRRHAAMAVGFRNLERRKTPTLCSSPRCLTEACIPLVWTIEQRIANP